MFEQRNARLLPQPEFIRRMGWSVAAGGLLIAFSLTLGMCGYHWLCGLAWIDAFLDAAMILSGMGPLSPVTTTAGKLFAGSYAIYCGIATGADAARVKAAGAHAVLVGESLMRAEDPAAVIRSFHAV